MMGRFSPSRGKNSFMAFLPQTGESAFVVQTIESTRNRTFPRKTPAGFDTTPRRRGLRTERKCSRVQIATDFTLDARRRSPKTGKIEEIRTGLKQIEQRRADGGEFNHRGQRKLPIFTWRVAPVGRLQKSRTTLYLCGFRFIHGKNCLTGRQPIASRCRGGRIQTATATSVIVIVRALV